MRGGIPSKPKKGDYMNFFNEESHKCDIENNPIENKKTHFCRKCESNFAGVCRYLLDENYK